MGDIDEELLEDLYAWIDQIPLSRPKKDIRRDFADGVLVAEVVKHYCPRMVEVHNYSAASGVDKKSANWKLLNRKVFKKLGFELADDVIRNISLCKSWAVEHFMMMLRRKIDRHLYEIRRTDVPPEKGGYDARPEADQAGGSTPATEQYTPAPAPKLQAVSTSNIPATGQKVTYRTEMVSKVHVEEKEQELLAKDETIQILQAKVRRLEHLLHLKDIRVDDLQSRLDRLETQLRPTGKGSKAHHR